MLAGTLAGHPAELVTAVTFSVTCAVLLFWHLLAVGLALQLLFLHLLYIM
jgi:hypothetical protein